MIRTKNAGFEKAKYVIREMSLTESLREAVEYYRKKRMDRKSEDAYVYNQGKEAGEQLGMERGIEIGKEALLMELVLSGNLDVDTAAEKCGITPKEFQEKLAEFTDKAGEKG
ncbi:MAG: hypothetical protein MSA09_01815 [Lachnospiraceae bacterium]|nr:hypothetical protein [Lachnospiraceae bacterium]